MVIHSFTYKPPFFFGLDIFLLTMLTTQSISQVILPKFPKSSNLTLSLFTVHPLSHRCSNAASSLITLVYCHSLFIIVFVLPPVIATQDIHFVFILSSVLTGMEYLHGHSIVHWDTQHVVPPLYHSLLDLQQDFRSLCVVFEET